MAKRKANRTSTGKASEDTKRRRTNDDTPTASIAGNESTKKKRLENKNTSETQSSVNHRILRSTEPKGQLKNDEDYATDIDDNNDNNQSDDGKCNNFWYYVKLPVLVPMSSCFICCERTNMFYISLIWFDFFIFFYFITFILYIH
jgi:hypothetical protein